MPHSPRVDGDRVLVLDSGRGQIVSVDPTSGKARGCRVRSRVSCEGWHSTPTTLIVTVSKPRNGTFQGLALDEAMKTRDSEPWCGVLIVDLRTGGIVEWVKLDGFITELFDVAAIPGVTCPMAVGPETLEVRSTITFDPIEAAPAA